MQLRQSVLQTLMYRVPALVQADTAWGLGVERPE
jgi:hypothetical protein